MPQGFPSSGLFNFNPEKVFSWT
uniref:Uncharacterized protein n=1 Tax=Anguilla anguilla TaxID=7936 RepID=A0A0E9PMW1_ANGAN